MSMDLLSKIGNWIVRKHVYVQKPMNSNNNSQGKKYSKLSGTQSRKEWTQWEIKVGFQILT